MRRNPFTSHLKLTLLASLLLNEAYTTDVVNANDSGTGSLRNAFTINDSAIDVLNTVGNISLLTPIDVNATPVAEWVVDFQNNQSILGSATSFNLNTTSLTLSEIGGLQNVVNTSSTNASILIFDLTNPFTWAGNLTSSGGLTHLIKKGSDQLELSGANSFNGSNGVEEGTLLLSNTGALTGPVTVNTGAILTFGDVTGTFNPFNVANDGLVSFTGSSGTQTFSGNISANGNVQKSGAGTSVLGGTNTFNGTTTINAGILQLASTAALPASGIVTVDTGATLTFGDVTGTFNSFNVVNNGAVFFTGSSGTQIFSGNISGSGDVQKSGAGTSTLGGTNTFSGTTTISEGILQIVSTAGLPASGVVNVDLNAGQLVVSNVNGTLNAFNVENGSNVTFEAGSGLQTTYPGTISSSGTVSKIGPGTAIFSGTNTYSGQTTVSEGTLQITSTSALANGSAVQLVGGGIVIGDLTGTTNAFDVVNESSEGVTFNISSTATYPGVISSTGSVEKIGGGTIAVTGSNSYEGATTVTEGTFQIGSATALSASTAVSVANDAEFRFDGINATVNSFNIENSGFVVFTPPTGNTTQYNGNISGSGSLSMLDAGTSILNGNNSYVGTTTVDSGILTFNSLAAIPNSSGYTIASGARVNFNANGSGSMFPSAIANAGTVSFDPGSGNTFIYPGNLSGAGTILIQQGGTFTFSGNNSFTGDLDVDSSIGNQTTLVVSSETAIPTGVTVTLTTTDAATPAILEFEHVNNPPTASVLDFDVVNNANCEVIFDPGGGSQTYYSGTISGAGDVIALTGASVFQGENTYTGDTNVNGGNLVLEATNALSASTAVNVAASGALTMRLFNGTTNAFDITNAGAVIFFPGTGNTITYGGVISSTGSVNIEEGGTTIFTGSNIYTGNTVVDIGTLQVNNATAISASSPIIVFESGNFVVNDINSTTNAWGITNSGLVTFTAASGNTTVFPGSISGAGNIVKTGIGTLSLTGVNSASSEFAVDAGTLRLNQVNNLSADISVTIDPSATLEFANISGTTSPFSIESFGTVLFSTGLGITTTYGGNLIGSGILSKVGAGTAVLTGPSPLSATNFGGSVIISAGELDINNAATLSAAATVTNNGVFQIGNINGTLSAFSVNNSGSFRFNPSSGSITNFPGALSGGGSMAVTNSGKVILLGNNTLTGATNVNIGTLQLNSAASVPDGSILVGSSGTAILNGIDGPVSPIITLNQGSLQITPSSNQTTQMGGFINGTGAVSINGLGNVAYTTNYSYSATTSVVSGTLFLNSLINSSDVTVGANGTLRGSGSMNNLTVNGTLFPGNSIDTITVLGDYVQAGGSTLSIELDSQGLTDLVDISGTATIQTNANLNVFPLNSGFNDTQTFTFLEADGGVTGVFSNVTLNNAALFGPYQIELQYNPTTIQLLVRPLDQEFANFSMEAELTDRINRYQIKNMDVFANFYDMKIRRNFSRKCMKKEATNEWDFYVLGGGLNGGFKASGKNRAGFYETYAATFAGQYHITPKDSFSFFTGYVYGKVGANDHLQYDFDNAISLGGGFETQQGSPVSFRLNLLGNYHFLESLRRVPHSMDSATLFPVTANHQAIGTAAEILLIANGYIKGLKVQPSIALTSSYTYFFSYKEKGLNELALNIDPANLFSLTANFGINFSEKITSKNITIYPYQRLAYTLDLYQHNPYFTGLSIDTRTALRQKISDLAIDGLEIAAGVELASPSSDQIEGCRSFTPEKLKKTRKVNKSGFAEIGVLCAGDQKATMLFLAGFRIGF